MEIALVVHDIRSCHNVGSLLRTADGLGVKEVFLTGYTPYPEMTNDKRLPHLRAKISHQIHKTALGAENSTAWSHEEDVQKVLTQLRQDGFYLVALEQTANSLPLQDFGTSSTRIALLIGREVEGIDAELIGQMDTVLEIAMLGAKESLNVVQATAMALYHFRFLATA